MRAIELKGSWRNTTDMITTSSNNNGARVAVYTHTPRPTPHSAVRRVGTYGTATRVWLDFHSMVVKSVLAQCFSRCPGHPSNPIVCPCFLNEPGCCRHCVGHTAHMMVPGQ